MKRNRNNNKFLDKNKQADYQMEAKHHRKKTNQLVISVKQKMVK